MATTFYFHCENVCDLVDKVAEAVNHDLDGNHPATIAYPIRFRVDETPTKEEWDKMDEREKRNAFSMATGTYGIQDTGRLFDSNDSLLVGGYYGGSSIHSTCQFDADNSDEEVHDIIESLIYGMLYAEDCQTNLLLRIDTL